VADYELSITGDGIGTPKVISGSQITAGATVAVDIKASKGIKTLVVNMESTNPEFDNTVRGELSPLDLSVETSPILDILSGSLNVNLPHGSDVVGQTAVVFDITEFLPMMAVFLPAGEFTSKFHLTVTDSEDHTLTETIELTLTN
jgi:hypothetical protein